MSELKSSMLASTELNALEPLTEYETYILAAVEQVWWTKKRLMDAKSTAVMLHIPVEDMVVLWQKPSFVHALRSKGFVDDRRFEGILTPKQVLCANMLSNRYDTRSFREKLKECGVTPSQYSAWMAEKNFNKYIQEKVGIDFASGDRIAMQTLMQNVEGGDTTALKLYLEIRGIYNNKVSIDVNINVLIEQLIEVALNYIAEEKWEMFASHFERVRGLHVGGKDDGTINVISALAPGNLPDI